MDGDPAELEGKLLDEQDGIEYEMGMEWLRGRDGYRRRAGARFCEGMASHDASCLLKGR